MTGATSDGYAEDWDLDQLWTSLKQLYPVGVTIEELEEEAGGSRDGIDADFLVARLKEDAHAAYERREEELGTEGVRQLERMVLLQVIDRKWREHLYEMDYLQEGINLRAYAQRDPVVEYQREGFDMFATMMDGIKEETVGFLYNVDVQVDRARRRRRGPTRSRCSTSRSRSGPRASAGPRGPRACSTRRRPSTVRPARARWRWSGRAAGTGARRGGRPAPACPAARARARRPPRSGRHPGCGPGCSVGRRPSAGTEPGGEQRPSRNAPCPCGSGRKYKRCHGAPAAATEPTAA